MFGAVVETLRERNDEDREHRGAGSKEFIERS